MILEMPPVRQVVSPNYTRVLIRHDKVFVHHSEGDYAGGIAWLCRREVQASTHIFSKRDGSETTQLVPLQFKAWAECDFNSQGISMEIEGFTKDGLPDDVAKPQALIVAWLCVAYAIPPVWAKGGQGRGVCQHVDLGAAGGGHVDACGLGSPDWLRFMDHVADYNRILSAGPLPPFLLHGLPNPHQIELPPDAPPTPSHGGAPRHEPGDTIAHPTSSGFPHGSVADLQWRLDKAGATLTVDGFAGPLTRNALATFQSKHGLYVDGLIGPKTWAALDAATST